MTVFHFYNTLTVQEFKIMLTLFVLFHAEKGGVFRGPNGFWIGVKKYHLLGFWGIGSTTVIIGWYYHLQIDTRWYHLSVWAVQLPDRARRSNFGGTTAWQGRYHHLTALTINDTTAQSERYHHPEHLGDRVPGDATVGPSGATADHDFRCWMGCLIWPNSALLRAQLASKWVSEITSQS